MVVKFSLPDISDPVIDRSTGLMTDAWYRFFELFERQTGLNVDEILGLTESVDAVEAEVDVVQNDVALVKQELATIKRFGFAWDRPVDSITPGNAIRFFDAGVPWTIEADPDDPDGHRGWIAEGSAPSSDTTFNIVVEGTTIGTMTFLSGSAEAVFSIAADYTVGEADTVKIVSPGALNGMTGVVYGTLLGVRV